MFGWTLHRNQCSFIMKQKSWVILPGYQKPVNLNSLFVHVRRSSLLPFDNLLRAMAREDVLNFSVRFMERWETLKCVPTSIQAIFDQESGDRMGDIIGLNPKIPGSFLETWPSALLWAPDSGPAGIIAEWKAKR